MTESETAAQYHARPAVSASLLWDIVSPESCPAQAWHNSAWLNPNHVEEPADELDHGTLIHLACLEPHLLDERIQIIDAPDWRTKSAQEQRTMARFNGRIPILYERKSGVCFTMIEAIREAIRSSFAGPLIFDGGVSEQSFLWEVRLPFGGKPKKGDPVIPCKARADRIVQGKIVDLKSAVWASPSAFQRAVARDGHHLRAAFYLSGWSAQAEAKTAPAWEYVFVVVAKEPPHLVSVFTLDERTLAWGDRLYRKGLTVFAAAHQTGVWAGYTSRIESVGLPSFAEYQLADLEAAGQL